MEFFRHRNQFSPNGALRRRCPRCVLALKMTLLVSLFQSGCCTTPENCVKQYNGVSYPDSLYFGHHATCWKQWPAEWVGCPGEAGEMIDQPPGPGAKPETLPPPTAGEANAASDATPPPTDMPPPVIEPPPLPPLDQPPGEAPAELPAAPAADTPAQPPAAAPGETPDLLPMTPLAEPPEKSSTQRAVQPPIEPPASAPPASLPKPTPPPLSQPLSPPSSESRRRVPRISTVGFMQLEGPAASRSDVVAIPASESTSAAASAIPSRDTRLLEQSSPEPKSQETLPKEQPLPDNVPLETTPQEAAPPEMGPSLGAPSLAAPRLSVDGPVSLRRSHAPQSKRAQPVDAPSDVRQTPPLRNAQAQMTIPRASDPSKRPSLPNVRPAAAHRSQRPQQAKSLAPAG